MLRRILLALGGISAITIVIALALTQVRSGPQKLTPTPCGSETYSGTPTPTPNMLTPIDPALLPPMPTAIQPTVVDLAPQIPYEDKPSVVVQHPDCSRTIYLVAPDSLEVFIENLPEEDILELVLSSPSVLAGSGEPDTPEP